MKKSQKIILSALLIFSLVVFNFPLGAVVAEGEEGGAMPTEDSPPSQNSEIVPESQPSADTTITTGDANGVSEVENVVNTNITELESEPAEQPPAGQTDESADQTEPEATETDSPVPPEENSEEESDINQTNNDSQSQGDGNSSQDNGSSTFDVDNDNQAVVENNLEQEGETGDNEAQSEQGDVKIKTGNVNLFTYLINIVNTNIFGSDFSQFLLNIFESWQGDFDLSDKIATSSGQCLGDGCINNFNISNDNEGVIANDILINGSSGDNLAQSHQGQAIISTGNVNVVADVLNILNSNIVGSNWTHFIINIFGDWMGDLVLPGKEAMQERFGQEGSAGCCEILQINNSNEGQIENEVTVLTETGDNTAIGGETSTIDTGQARSKVNVFNLANTNLTGSNLFLMQINNFGHWQGNIFSLPAGFGIGQDEAGIQIFNLDSGGLGNSSSSATSSLNVVNNNSGLIQNQIVINALTGGNSAYSGSSSATITTGDANILANLINILNTNITGQNWLFGMINIFGLWQGDLAFGRPDNWIGLSAATSPNPAMPGAQITYTLSYINNGNADATNVTIQDDFDERYTSVINSNGGVVVDNPGEIRWDIGTVPAGGYGRVSYSVIVNDDIPAGVSSIQNTAQISSFEDDGNPQDNLDIISVNIYRQPAVYSANLPDPPNFEISQTNSADTPILPGSNIDFKTLLFNNSHGAGYNVVVTNTLRFNGEPEILDSQNWELGEIFPHEKVLIEFTLNIGEQAPLGIYISESQAIGEDREGNSVSSPKFYTTFEVKAPDEEENSEEQTEEPTGEAFSSTNESGQEEPQIEASLPELPANPKITRIKSLLSESIEEQKLIPEAAAAESGNHLSPEPSQSQTKEILSNLFAAIGGLSWPSWIILLVIFLAALLALFWLGKRRK